MKIKLEVDRGLLVFLCETMLYLEVLDDEEFASRSHREIALDSRVNLGAKAFRAALKVPIPKTLTISEQEAALIDFSVRHYPTRYHDETRYARMILQVLQPKLI